MNSWVRNLTLIVVGASLLAGCSTLSDTFSSVLPKEDPNPPKALQAIQSSANVATVWQTNTGSNTAKDYVRLSPNIGDSAVFVAGGGSASAWDKRTGKLLWRRAISEEITAGVNGGEGLIFLGTTEGNAIALDSRNGETRWVEPLDSEVLSVSAARNGRVAFRSSDGKLSGLATQTGETVWQQTRPTPILSLRSAGVPVIVGDVVIAGFDNGTLTAFDVQSGTSFWEALLSIPRGSNDLDKITDVDGKLAVVGSALFAAGYNGQIAGVDMREGNIVWAEPFSSHAGVAANQDGVYASNERGEIWKLRPKTGEPVWKMDDLQRRSPTAPTLLGDYIIVGDFAGYLHWINTQTGRIGARQRSDQQGYTVAPVAEGRFIYTFGRSGVLAAHTLQASP